MSTNADSLLIAKLDREIAAAEREWVQLGRILQFNRAVRRFRTRNLTERTIKVPEYWVSKHLRRSHTRRVLLPR